VGAPVAGERPPSEGTVDQFLGEYEHSLDAKGRLILPAKFRAPLDDGAVLTIGKQHCLVVVTREEWGRMAESADEKAREDDERSLAAARALFALAQAVSPDGQGRIPIPENLRRYAGLDKKVVVTGVLKRIEIWDEQRWLEEKERGQALLAGSSLPGVGS
jgi:MraZ protein